MHPLIEQNRAGIARLCRRFGVRRPEVSGSAARGVVDFDPATSDAGFLVDFAPGSALPVPRRFFGLAEALEQLPGRPVDLARPGAIRNPYPRQHR